MRPRSVGVTMKSKQLVMALPPEGQEIYMLNRGCDMSPDGHCVRHGFKHLRPVTHDPDQRAIPVAGEKASGP